MIREAVDPIPLVLLAEALRELRAPIPNTTMDKIYNITNCRGACGGSKDDNRCHFTR
jgi:hypothetical protein